jgi:tetratricopeptide (TPR) repeat protein
MRPFALSLVLVVCALPWTALADCPRSETPAAKLAEGTAIARRASDGAGSWTEARDALATAVRLDPNLAAAHFELADVLLHLGDDKGALVHFTKAIESKPDEVGFYKRLADLYLRLGYVEQAERTLQEALSWDKNDEQHRRFELQTLYGEVSLRKADLVGAMSHFEDAKRTCGQCVGLQARIYFDLGRLYANTKPPRKSEAIVHLQSFTKMVCRGAAVARNADACMETQDLLQRVTTP